MPAHLDRGKMASVDFRIGSWPFNSYWTLGILLLNVGQVMTQTCKLVPHPEELTFQDVDTNKYISVSRRHSEALAPLYNMQKMFLNAVQPNPFPKELMRVIITDASLLKTTEVVKYQAGYVVCAVIAILFVIFMLILGIIFCLFQYQGRKILPCESVLCQRTPVFVGLLITVCCLFAGVVCTFYLNQRAHHEVRYGVEDLLRTLQGFRLSVTSIPQAMEKVVTEFEVPKSRVLADLKSFGPAINRTVNDRINDEIRPLLQEALETVQELDTAVQEVLIANETLEELRQRQKVLDMKLINHREKLLTVLTDPNCKNCVDAANLLQNVQLGNTQVLSLNALANKLSGVSKINLVGIMQKALQALDTMPKFVSTQTSRSISDVVDALDKTEAEIRTYASDMPIQRYIEPISSGVLKFEDKAMIYGGEVERYEYYRWIVGVILCCVLLLITTCTILGLLFGVWGLYLLRNPDNSKKRQRDAAVFFTIEVYLTFLFSWLLILFVFITFLVGGNLQTLVCRSWDNGDIYKFLDDPKNLPNNINLKKQLGLRESSSFTDMYKKCKSGSPIWDVLQFSSPIDLDSAFNITQYTGDLEKKIDNFTVNVAALNMMSTIAVRALQEYNRSGVEAIPFDSLRAQLQTPFDMLHVLKDSVPALEAISAMQNNATIRSQLENDTETLKSILNTTVRDQEATMRKLNNSISTLAPVGPTLKVGIQRTIENINALKGPLITGTIDMLRNESKCLLNQAIGYFTQYIGWVKTTIIDGIASCRSVSVTLDSARVIVCDNVTNPWNGFWFCLGWCTLSLIANILLSIKAAQLIAPKARCHSSGKYRKIKRRHKME
ncbi:prominin-2 isoform X2 [Hyperolius riggenbachi]|uniref:prominin-2 isoform X2 n=1 Tax=Hyperolius riggenbachi TaxID=752182 RepID=UPI0035A37BE2